MLFSTETFYDPPPPPSVFVLTGLTVKRMELLSKIDFKLLYSMFSGALFRQNVANVANVATL